VHDLKEQNKEFKEQLEFEMRTKKKNKDMLLDQLAASYEERLVEAKMLAKKLSNENMRMIEQMRDKDL
jgi:hypothetical protein